MNDSELVIPLDHEKRNLLSSACAAVALSSPLLADDPPLRFTSAPDIFNWNISNPQPGWEETIDWFFDRLHKD